MTPSAGSETPHTTHLPPPAVLVPQLFAKVADETKRDAEVAARGQAEAAGTGSPQVGVEPQRSGGRCSHCGEACTSCNLETVLDETPCDPLSDEEVARVMGSVLRMGAFEDLLAACEVVLPIFRGLVEEYYAYREQLAVLEAAVAKAKGTT